MFRYLSAILICLSFFNTVLPGQGSVDYSKMISEKYQCSADTCIVNHLNTDYIETRSSNLDSAMSLVYHALNISRKIFYKKGLTASYYNIADGLSFSGQIDTAFIYLDSALILALEANDQKKRADIVNLQGILHSDMGEYEKSIEYYERAMKIYVSIEYRLGIANSFNNIGISNYRMADYETAISNYMKSFEILEAMNDSIRISTMLGNLAVFYDLNGDIDKALETNLKSLSYLEGSNFRGRAGVLNNIGSLHVKLGDSKKGLEYFMQALEYQLKVGDTRGIAATYNNIATTYMNADQYGMAIPFFEKAVLIAKESGYKHDEAWYLKSIAACYFYKPDFKKAEKYALMSLEMTEELDVQDLIRDIYFLLADIYREIKQFEKATNYMFLFKNLNDSILNEEHQRNITDMEVKYETKSLKDANLILVQDQEIQSAALNRQKIINWATGAGLILALALGFFIYRGYVEKKKAHIEITIQHDIIEEQHKDIMDSIEYAKRLQGAILPSNTTFHKHLKDAFVLYLPKDIVAGDFYWMHPTGDQVLFAAADCTGHGVPGAMLSMVCHNSLNKSVDEFGLTEPASILDKTRELVIATFDKGDEEVKDGMDISLCSWNSKTKTLGFAGAYNGLYLIRGGEVLETKADKQPIGLSDDPWPFTNHELKLEAGDTIYIFSDGFQDQFGGPKEKKFMIKRFKELLISLQDKSIKEQSKVLETTLNEWKGDVEQVDDICVIGMQV